MEVGRRRMGDGGDPVAVFRARLKELHRLIRSPTYRELRKKADLDGVGLPPATLGALLNGPGLPRWETVEAFVKGCRKYAEINRPPLSLPPAMVDLNVWW